MGSIHALGTIFNDENRYADRLFHRNGLTPFWPLVTIETMLSHVVRVFLVIAVVSTAGMGSFAHIHPTGHGSQQPEGSRTHDHSAHDRSSGAHWHLTGLEATEKPGTIRLAGNLHRHASVRVEVLAVDRSSVRIGATSPLVEAWWADIVPMPSAWRLSIVTKASPDLPPPIVLPARAPPI